MPTLKGKKKKKIDIFHYYLLLRRSHDSLNNLVLVEVIMHCHFFVLMWKCSSIFLTNTASLLAGQIFVTQTPLMYKYVVTGWLKLLWINYTKEGKVLLKVFFFFPFLFPSLPSLLLLFSSFRYLLLPCSFISYIIIPR